MPLRLLQREAVFTPSLRRQTQPPTISDTASVERETYASHRPEDNDALTLFMRCVSIEALSAILFRCIASSSLVHDLSLNKLSDKET